MKDVKLRMECLHMARTHWEGQSAQPAVIIDTAERFYDWARGDEIMAPECKKSSPQLSHPDIVAISAYEGEAWIPWEDFQKIRYSEKNIHALRFSDGSVWDSHNGWRPKSMNWK